MRYKALTLRLTLIAISCLVALAFVEGALRLYGVSGSQDRLSIYEFDEELGWVTRKSQKQFRSTAAYAHFTYYNPDGFPTDRSNWDTALDRDKPSIAFVGDSFAEGYYLPYEFTFTHLLDQKVPEKQVVNLGVSGYSPDQYLLGARRHLGDYKVTDIVVMFFSGNDLTYISSDTMQGYAKPVFDGTFEQPENTPLRNNREAARSDIGLIQRVEALADKTATFRTLKPFLGDLRQLGGIEGTFAPTPVLHEAGDMRKSLSLIKQIQVEFPVDNFIVYFVPLMEEIEDQDIFEHNLGLFMAICEELEMRCHSPEEVLRNGVTPSEMYTPGEGHFSRYGASLVANDIYRIITGEADEG